MCRGAANIGRLVNSSSRHRSSGPHCDTTNRFALARNLNNSHRYAASGCLNSLSSAAEHSSHGVEKTPLTMDMLWSAVAPRADLHLKVYKFSQIEGVTAIHLQLPRYREAIIMQTALRGENKYCARLK